MQYNDLVVALSKENGLSVSKTRNLLKSFTSKVLDSAREGKALIPHFGTFLVVDRSARVKRNPKTGALVNVPAKKVLKFRTAKAVKVLLN